jgi:hypothetical protein
MLSLIYTSLIFFASSFFQEYHHTQKIDLNLADCKTSGYNYTIRSPSDVPATTKL